MNYENDNRGKIQYRDRARQIIDFSNLRYGNITPTDIDGLIEYHDKAVLFLEYKYLDAEMPRGQKIAYERIVNDIQRNKDKDCALFVCSHDVHDCNQDIDASKAVVMKIYWHGEWIGGKEKTVKEHADNYFKWIDNKSPF